MEDNKKDENKDAKCCLVVIACILGLIVAWWFWMWVLPLFDVFILVYVGWSLFLVYCLVSMDITNCHFGLDSYSRNYR